MDTQKKESPVRAWLRNPSADIWLFAVVLVLLNLVAVRAFARWDLTASRSYSLSRASKEIVRTVQEPLSIKVFFTKNLPAQYNSVYQYVQDILSEYKTAAGANFSYELADLSKPENENRARDYGLNQIQIRELKNNEVGFKNVFMGMVITYADQLEVLDAITSTDGLEYKITSTISRVIAQANELSGLSGAVTATLFQSQNLAALDIDGFADLEPAVREAVAALNRKYGDRIELTAVSPASGDIAALHERYGVPSVPVQAADGSYSYGTVALVLENGEASRCIPFGIGQSIDLFRGVFLYVLQGLDTVQDDIDSCVRSLAARMTTVAYVTGHGELPLADEEQGAAYLASRLEERYVLKEVDLSAEDIPVGVGTVMVNGPHTAFSDAELYKLDQFLLKGGHLLLFLDPFTMEQGMYGADYEPLATGLETLLAAYGITCSPEYVFDEECAISYDNRTGRQLRAYYIPVLRQQTLNQKHPVTRNLGLVGFLLPGSIDADAARQIDGETVTVLARTSAKSWAQRENIQLDPAYIVPPDTSARMSADVAVLVEGSFGSAFGAEPPAAEGESAPSALGDAHVQRSVQPGKVLVVSTSFVTGPDVSMQFFEPTVMLVQNAVDYLSGNGDLCTMRTKGLNVSSLHTTNGAAVTFFKYLNEVGLAVLVAVAGLLVLLARRRHRTEIRLRYDPDDARELPEGKEAQK